MASNDAESESDPSVGAFAESEVLRQLVDSHQAQHGSTTTATVTSTGHSDIISDSTGQSAIVSSSTTENDARDGQNQVQIEHQQVSPAANHYDSNQPQQQPQQQQQPHLDAELAPSRTELANMIRQELQSELVVQIEQQFRDHGQATANPPPLVETTCIEHGDTVASSSDDPMSHRSNDQPRRKWIIAIAIIALVIAAVGLGVGLFLNNAGDKSTAGIMDVTAITTTNPTDAPTNFVILNTSPPSFAPVSFEQTEKFFFIMDLLKPSLMGPPTSFEESTFTNRLSIQYQVLDWMANVDEETTLILSLPTIPDPERVRLLLERYCAYSLFVQWGGGDWLRLPRPSLQDISVCVWNDGERFGVWCNSDGSIEVINLTENNLQGPVLPLEIYHLRYLKVLAVPVNPLTGSISPMIAQYIPGLVHLVVAVTGITGTLPTELGTMTDMEVMHVVLTELAGTIPTELAQLTNMLDLQLGGNFLTGTVPSEMARMASLEQIFFAGNHGIYGTVPEEFARLTNLVGLTLFATSITGNLDPLFCSIDNPFDRLTRLMSDCLGSTLDGKELSRTVCSCCSHCNLADQVVITPQNPQPAECDNAGCVACDLGVYAASCSECPLLSNDEVEASGLFDSADAVIPLQRCLGACTWNYENSVCEPRTEFGL